MDYTSIREELRTALEPFRTTAQNYSVPSLWTNDASFDGKPPAAVPVNPADFLGEAVELIANEKPSTIRKTAGGEWTRDAVIYNMFVRSTCAFDHNGNGRLDLPLNAEGWRETGTFLKAIALLPHAKALGANTIHLLPITAIGSDGNKGTLGSPYAIRNPYQIDASLAEPNAGLGVEKEFRLFVESAHRLGLRVVVEFVFRTESKDGDWVKEHPEWFYWIKEKIRDRAPGVLNEHEYGNPVFTPEELKAILDAVEREDLSNLPPPHDEYRKMFTTPPPKESIKLEKGRYIGVTANGERVRIPGAFADWPPQDTQPPWGDVTYLKMYDNPDFNYIAYSTIRMYDRRLARKEFENRPLWEKIAEIIPHYQHTFGIDGVMIDMGHALPMDLKQDMIRRARAIDPDFAFWDENFSITPKSVKEGYNAVIGYQWSDQHHPEKYRNMLRRFSGEGFALPFFATAESHNTPRAAAREGGLTYSRYSWALSNLVPAIPFIHSGFEIGETYPINTGLDFTHEDLKKLPSEKLPLFSEYAYDWLRKENCLDWICAVSEIRAEYHDVITNCDASSFRWIEDGHPDVIAFVRLSAPEKPVLLVVANSSMKETREASIPADTRHIKLNDLLGSGSVPVEHHQAHCTLAPGQVMVFEL